MENHPIAECYPKLAQGEYEQLKAHIAANGLQNSIVLYEGKILDGTQRARACQELGFEPSYVTPEIKDPYEYVIGQNERRRQLSNTQKLLVAEKLAKLKHGSNQHRKKEEASHEASSTQAQICKRLGVAESTMQKVRYAQHKGIPEVIKAFEEEKIAPTIAYGISRLPKEQQATALEGAKHKKHKTQAKEQVLVNPDADALAATEQRCLERINRPSLYPIDLPLPIVPDSAHKTEHIQEAIAELRPLEPLIATMGWRQLYDEVQLNVQRIQTYGDKFTRVGLGDYRIELPWQHWAEDVGQKVQARVTVLFARKRHKAEHKVERKSERRPTRSGPERRFWDYRKKLNKLLRDIDFLQQECDQAVHETMLIVATYFEERRALYTRHSPHQNGVEPNGQTPSLK